MSPAAHFAKYGAIELRNPGPNFDMRRYAARFGHYAQTGLDPLAHYLAFGRKEGLDLGRLCLTVDDFELPPAVRRTRRDWAVDVIVPVTPESSKTK